MKKQYGNITVIHGDALEILPTLEEKADCIVTDPPYLLPKGEQSKLMGGKFKGLNCNNDGRIVPCSIDWVDFVPPMYDAIKSNYGYMAIMSNHAHIANAINASKETGFRKRNTVIWNKGAGIHSRHGGCMHIEFINIFSKGLVSNLPNSGLPSIITQPNTQSKKHPTIKPVKLMEVIIHHISKEGDLVIDPFGGSGSTAIACHKLGRRCIIIEKDKDYFDLMCDQLNKTVNVNNVDDALDLFGVK